MWSARVVSSVTRSTPSTGLSRSRHDGAISRARSARTPAVRRRSTAMAPHERGEAGIGTDCGEIGVLLHPIPVPEARVDGGGEVGQPALGVAREGAGAREVVQHV